MRAASPMPLTFLNDLKASSTKVIARAIMIAETKRNEAQLGNPHWIKPYASAIKRNNKESANIIGA